MIRPKIQDTMIVIWRQGGITYIAHLYFKKRIVRVYDGTNDKLVYIKYNVRNEELVDWRIRVAKMLAMDRKSLNAHDVEI